MDYRIMIMDSRGEYKSVCAYFGVASVACRPGRNSGTAEQL